MTERLLSALLFVGLLGTNGFSQVDVGSVKKGEVLLQSNEYGSYCVYIPRRRPSRVLVVVHGMPGKSQTTKALAETFIKRWVTFAKKHRLLLISPSFNRDNFGATGFGYGGYRGLFGREQGADDFLLGLVDSYAKLCDVQDGRFLLYGHSAGGQFTIRFSVRHPDRIAAAVCSAPGRFAYPSANATWPYGMGKFDRDISWSETEVKRVRFTPVAENWSLAAKLPIAVVYGENDLDPQPNRPAHPGTTRIDYGTAWVSAMNALHKSEDPTVNLVLVPKIGHDSKRLTDECQKQFRRLKWIEPQPLQQFRQWTSQDGNYQVDALFLDRDDSQVRLKKRDGTTLEVEISRLSQADVSMLPPDQQQNQR